MKVPTFIKAASLLAPLLTPLANAQDVYTDAKTGIIFERTVVGTDQTSGGFQWGYALPATAGGTNDEYLGYMVGSLQSGRKGWSGISHGGGMPNALLLIAWPESNAIKTKFVYAGGYVTPEDYTGNATLTQISSSVNDTHFELIYRCQWCWVWNQKGAEGSQLPTTDVMVIGWAQHKDVPSNPLVFHNNGQSQFGVPVAAARQSSYAAWTTK